MNAPFVDVAANLAKLDSAVLSRLLARRIQDAGGDPFASDRERYAVLVGDDSGEIVELGRPLRGSRLFPTKALRRNIDLLGDLEAFAAEQDVSDWKYWEIKITGRKADPNILKSELERFNTKINNVFTLLRKKHSFKLVLLTIHVRFDHFSGLFDLHAHFVCDVPREATWAVRVHLLEAFSKCDVPDKPIRNFAAVVTYSLWGIYRPDEALTWPNHALEAVWALHSGRSRPHLVRTGKMFQEWRRMRSVSTEKSRQVEELRRKRENRRVTRDPRPHPQAGDRLLAKAAIRIRGQEIVALIVEKGPGPVPISDSSSTTVDTSQPTETTTGAAPSSFETSFSEMQPSPTDSPSPAEGALPLTEGASPKLEDGAVDDNEGSSRKRRKPPCKCLKIPARHQWWLKAWPSPHSLAECRSGPIRRRLAKSQPSPAMDDDASPNSGIANPETHASPPAARPTPCTDAESSVLAEFSGTCGRGGRGIIAETEESSVASEIPERRQWWLKAWPSPHGLTVRSGSIRRRLARLSTWRC